MDVWQQEYLNRLGQIDELRKLPQSRNPAELETAIHQRRETIRSLALENAELIREQLFPVLGSVAGADDETLAGLERFAAELYSGGRRDNNLALHIHEALLFAARCRHDRDFLIRELYWCGLCSFYFLDNALAGAAPEKFLKKVRLYFREGASYLRVYDEISNPQTRGYIHRCMGNIAMSYSAREPLQKLEVINNSIRVLSDPVYRAKTPELPWDRYLLASHQERTTLLRFLRSGEATPEVAGQVMESAQIIRNAQLQRARQQGRPLEPRWEFVYISALFFTGITDIRDYLNSLLQIQRSASPEDYSPNGLYANVGIAAYLSEALATYGASVREEYAPRLNLVLGQAVDYLHRASLDSGCTGLYHYAGKLLQGFSELPGGLCLRELFHRLAPLAHRDLYLHSAVCARLNRRIARLVLQHSPGLLDGLAQSEQALLDYAEDAGLFHDIGLLLYHNHYLTPIRLLLQQEEELRQRHTFYGWELLRKSPSACRCAWVALGHHGPEGYPAEYRREEDPAPLLTDLTTLSDFLSRSICGFFPDLSRPVSLEQCLAELAENREGRFHPVLAELVCRRSSELVQAVEEINRELYHDLWQTFNGPQPGN